MELTPETRKNLENEIIRSIKSNSKTLDSLRKNITLLDATIASYNEKKVAAPLEIQASKRIGEYGVLLCLIWLDLAVAYKIYLDSEEKYEVLYSCKQLIIILNEGFKKIYGYLPSEKSKTKGRIRSRSFWINDIALIVKGHLPQHQDSYKLITKDLDIYDDDELQGMKAPRSFFVHYDETPSKVYDELLKQDIETLSHKVIPFMHLLTRMINFNKDLVEGIGERVNTNFERFKKENIEKITNLKLLAGSNPDAINILNDLQDKLLNLGGGK